MPYTHKIEIKGKYNEADYFIIADAEFNTDGKTSYKLTDSSDPLPKQVFDVMTSLSNLCMVLTRLGFSLEKMAVTEE